MDFLIQKHGLADADSMLAAGEFYSRTTPKLKGIRP
jgi:hypothetical protein